MSGWTGVPALRSPPSVTPSTGWYLRLPGHAQQPIARAFRSKSLPKHLAGFWELYVHELALSLGFDADVDIGREDPSDRRPDFRLRREGGCALLVEATVIIGDDATAPSERQRVDQLYDAIQAISVRDYLLDVAAVEIGTSTPGKRSIGQPLEHWLRSLDYEAVLALRNSDEPRPSRTFCFDDWRVRIKAAAWLPELRGRADLGVIGSKVEGISEAGGGDAFKQIRDVEAMSRQLRKKAGLYGKPDDPYVIAALCAGPFVSDHDIAQALIGPIEYRITPGDAPNTGSYLPGGLWLGPQGLRNTRVSGVVTVAGLRPTGIAVVQPVLWTAPSAANPLCGATPLRTFAFDTQAAVSERQATSTIAQILGV